jgi:hypothetical protein
VTGLIVDARGLKAEPAIAPRLVDESGKEVYAAALVDKEKFHDHGSCAYVTSLDAAGQDKRVGTKPMTVKAVKIATGGKSDLVLSQKDVSALLGPAGTAKFLNEGNVVIVID